MKEYSVAEHYFSHSVGQALLRLVGFQKSSGAVENYWTRSRTRAEAAAMMLELEIAGASGYGYDFVVVEREEGTKEWNRVTDNE